MTSHCPSESSAVGYFALVRGFVVFGAACLQHSRGTHPLTESFVYIVLQTGRNKIYAFCSYLSLASELRRSALKYKLLAQSCWSKSLKYLSYPL